nr:hypothetical protein [Kibdelosporangium sp. MJ126-NF4]CTQ98506.1 hypothetical protein [Kibdelosporangium sp. MJ126-NF4]
MADLLTLQARRLAENRRWRSGRARSGRARRPGRFPPRLCPHGPDQSTVESC